VPYIGDLSFDGQQVMRSLRPSMQAAAAQSTGAVVSQLEDLAARHNGPDAAFFDHARDWFQQNMAQDPHADRQGVLSRLFRRDR
jgi:hypothetical protein